VLMEQREFYRSERDYFRDQVSHFVPSNQLPARPTSPKLLRSSSETVADMPRKVEAASGSSAHPGTPVSTTRPGGSWTAPPATYPAQTEQAASDERQTRPMPPIPGTWNRPT
jgi:hypothetical protein